MPIVSRPAVPAALRRLAAVAAALALLAGAALPPAARADSVVVFNEIMYHPEGDEAALEWLELHNQMGVDVDLSGWSLSRGVRFVFPPGTILPGRGYLVVASDPGALEAVLAHAGGELFDARRADELGLATFAPDEIDWEDELRLAVEERASFSPDALTGMEANLRFPGPETLETKIFGRLSAWQNWIFQRPNAVGERGALVCYGTPVRPEFAPERT